MGFLSSLGNAAKSFLTTNPVGKTITKSLDTLSAVVINPVTAITQGISAADKKTKESSITTNVVKTITNVGLAAAAVTGAGLIAEGGIGAAGSAASKLIPSTTKGKVIAAVAAPVVAGAAIKQPAKTAEAVLNTPSSLANFGSNAAELLANPSIENVKTLVKENPVVATAAGAAVVTAAGVGVGTAASVLSTIQNTRSVKENTQATLGNVTVSDGSGVLFTSQPTQLVQTPAVNKVIESTDQAPKTPTMPQTQGVNKKSSPKKRKARKKAVMPSSINQKVNVIVSNRNSSVGIKSSKKYINAEVLA